MWVSNEGYEYVLELQWGNVSRSYNCSEGIWVNNEEMGVCLATAMRECESTIYHLCSLEQVRDPEDSKTANKNATNVKST